MAHCRPTFANTEVWEEFQAHLSQLFRSKTAGTFEEACNVFTVVDKIAPMTPQKIILLKLQPKITKIIRIDSAGLKDLPLSFFIQ